MKIEDINKDLLGPMGDDFYEVVALVMDSIMKAAAEDEDEVMKVYEVLFQSMFENALLYNYIVSAGLITNPTDVLKMKSDIEEHIERIAKKRMAKYNVEQGNEVVEDENEEEGLGVWSMDQMKEFMEGKEN
jgi:hypothetical protein